MNMDDNVVSRTTKTQKVFNFEQGHCFYQNIEACTKKKENQQDHQVKILNNICHYAQNKLNKLTEIHFRDRTLIIEDFYCFDIKPNLDIFYNDRSTTGGSGSSDGSQTNNARNKGTSNNKHAQKKKLIFKKKMVDAHDGYYLEKRNTKNIAKNFCRAFLAYLEDNGNQGILTRAKSLISANKFNNKTIEKIATDQQLKGHFKYFLVNKAHDWINLSKVNDKEIHRQAIQLYLKLIGNGGINAGYEEINVSESSESDQLFQSESGHEQNNQNNQEQPSVHQ